MGGAGQRRVLVSRAGAHPEADGDRADLGHRLGHHPDSAWEFGDPDQSVSSICRVADGLAAGAAARVAPGTAGTAPLAAGTQVSELVLQLLLEAVLEGHELLVARAGLSGRAGRGAG